MKLPLQHLSRVAAIVLVLAAATTAKTPAQQGESQPNSGGNVLDSNTTAIHRLYEECLNQERFDLIPELVSQNVVGHFGQGGQSGIAAFIENSKHVRAMFPGGTFTVDGVVSNGDMAAAHWTMRAIHQAPIAGIAPTGKPIVNHGVVFYRFEHRKIAEIWLEVDQVGVLRQVGVNIPGLPVPPSPTR